jgi:hypothetical protein
VDQTDTVNACRYYRQRTLTAGFPDGVKTRSATVQACKEIHPDQRRPAYPTARVNEAKDVLRRHNRKLRTLVRLTNSWPRRWFWRVRSLSRQMIESIDVVMAPGKTSA